MIVGWFYCVHFKQLVIHLINVITSERQHPPPPQRKTPLNLYAANTAYIRVKVNFKLNKIPLKFVTFLVVDTQVIN